MTIRGDITLEDICIIFELNYRDNTVDLLLHECIHNRPIRTEHIHNIPAAAFFAALSIAVHNDGMPDYNADYPAAESIMGDIRWIP